MTEVVFRHPNGELDDSTHVHAWAVPVEHGHLGPPDARFTLVAAMMCWCNLCGALGLGIGPTKTMLRPSFYYGRREYARIARSETFRAIAGESILAEALTAFAEGRDEKAIELRKTAKTLYEPQADDTWPAAVFPRGEDDLSRAEHVMEALRETSPPNQFDSDDLRELLRLAYVWSKSAGLDFWDVVELVRTEVIRGDLTGA